MKPFLTGFTCFLAIPISLKGKVKQLNNDHAFRTSVAKSQWLALWKLYKIIQQLQLTISSKLLLDEIVYGPDDSINWLAVLCDDFGPRKTGSYALEE